MKLFDLPFHRGTVLAVIEEVVLRTHVDTVPGVDPQCPAVEDTSCLMPASYACDKSLLYNVL